MSSDFVVSFPPAEGHSRVQIVAQKSVMHFTLHFYFHLFKGFSDDYDDLHAIGRTNIQARV